jgi:hypothetical protein
MFIIFVPGGDVPPAPSIIARALEPAAQQKPTSVSVGDGVFTVLDWKRNGVRGFFTRETVK